jgi:serine/threonine protein kinase
MAPEIHARKPYNGAACDLFALAIALFIMMSKTQPFASAQKGDPLYKRLYTGEERFWILHEKSKPPGWYTPYFKSLITSMLALDPTIRPSISEIQSHPWFNEPTATTEEVLGELQKRGLMVQEAAYRAHEEKLVRLGGSPNRFGVQSSGRVFKTGLEESLGLSLTAERASTKTIKSYIRTANKFTEFFSTYSADELLLTIADYFENMEGVELEMTID